MRPNNLQDLATDHMLWRTIHADCLALTRFFQRGDPMIQLVPEFCSELAELLDVYLRDDDTHGVSDMMLTAPSLVLPS